MTEMRGKNYSEVFDSIYNKYFFRPNLGKCNLFLHEEVAYVFSGFQPSVFIIEDYSAELLKSI